LKYEPSEAQYRSTRIVAQAHALTSAQAN
jgi:hypothetical protein